MIQQSSPNKIKLASNRTARRKPDGGWAEITMDDNSRHPSEFPNATQEKVLRREFDEPDLRAGQNLLRKLAMIPRASRLAIAVTEGIPNFNMPVSESQLWAYETAQAVAKRRHEVLQWILSEVGPIAEASLAELLAIIDANRDKLPSSKINN